MQEDESKIKWSQFLAGDNEAYCWIYKVYIQMLFRYGHNFTSDTELIKAVSYTHLDVYKRQVLYNAL